MGRTQSPHCEFHARRPGVRALLRPAARAAVLGAALLALSACPGREEAATPPAAANTTDPQWVHRQEPRADTALVFVHGIFGDTLGTWTSAEGTRFFDLVEQDGEVGPKVDVLAFGYTSKMIGTGSFDIQEAANRLHLYLENKGALDYPAIVFVAHSMGGLVVLRELLTHRDLLGKVKLILLYATPQEGAQVTTIARHLAENPAIEQMLPADRNGYLRVLNDEWKALGPERPRVLCAYEKQPTHGIMIVPWSSATRFCDEPAAAIDADHLSIVKPDRPSHDSMVFLATQLENYVVGEQLTAKLETPDFVEEGDHALLTISDPARVREARLINAGGTELRYTLAEFPDRGLLTLTGLGPARIPANDHHTLKFALGFGAEDDEYRFRLNWDPDFSRTIVVRVPGLAAVRQAAQARALAVSGDLARALADEDEIARLKALGADDPAAARRLVELAQASIAQQHPGLDEEPGGRWLLTADLLQALNWPGLAVHALRNAEQADPALAENPSVRRLASVSAALAGQRAAFERIAVTPVELEAAQAEVGPNPLTAAPATATAARLANQLKEVPALSAQGFSLEGDLKAVRGDKEGALAAYGKAGALQMSPSIRQRSLSVRDNRFVAPGLGTSRRPGAASGAGLSRSEIEARSTRIQPDSVTFERDGVFTDRELRENARPPGR